MMTPAALEKQGIKDFQLYYALNTIKRLSSTATIAVGGDAEEAALVRSMSDAIAVGSGRCRWLARPQPPRG